MKPWDWSKNLVTSTTHLLDADPDLEKEYDAWSVNNSLSFYRQAILYANEMNIRFRLPKRWQYDYYHHAINKRPKAFAKMTGKATGKKDVDVMNVARYYNYTFRRAKDLLSVLTPEQLKEIEKKLDLGG